MNTVELEARVRVLIERYEALQNSWEVVHLLEYLTRIEPKLIIEVGVYRGGNAAILKTFFPKARYIGVDQNEPRADVIADFGLEMVYGDSRASGTSETVRAMIGDLKADYLFIDASHDTDSVRRDYYNWAPLAKRVGFHDVHNPMVLAFWREITAFESDHARTAALWKEMDGHGIGVVMT